MNGPLPDDIRAANDHANGSEALWQAVTQLQLGKVHKTNPNLIWRAGSRVQERTVTGWQDAAYRGFLAQQERNAFAETLKVRRDACPYCGVRGDIGCAHSRRFA